MSNLSFTTYESPIGTLYLTSNQDALLGVSFISEIREEQESSPVLDMAMQQLDAYFNGKLQQFTVPFELQGTAFQKTVWEALCTIPYATVVSYQDIAIAIGNPKAVRAVGMANNKNPISIIIPCHRVIGKQGSLTGYAGGLDKKQWLLSHERSNQSNT
ncbi:MAG: methylated-DNA--[protein]-cysteine S-methyltransferase [Sphaerochaeta sp.]|nr:methylated-DNA--[protein]-cysteine S-methyltransferase [Sphaerochaeta sp.]MDD4301133.1 methylated-DNA--[protein]-cysteine S-methyltransferase [Sphaerochaeta sp.]MDD4648176.1 methylated-DNA--[protein]-cysteine S-methyltransferase [Sphaerochaeta sp.]MDY0245099.1 methylated-DNA--[protein]-cysteine S-methyltransferase [Sphaerochaeta sp.]